MVGEDRYLTVKQVAERLGVGKSSVFDWAKRGVFPRQKKFGTTSRWSLAEVEAWIASRPTGAYGEGGKP
jgi:excisionase family DNA binding protein